MKAVKKQNIKVNNLFKLSFLGLSILAIFSSCEDPSRKIKNEKLSLQLEKADIFINNKFYIGIGKQEESFDSIFVNGSRWDNYDPDTKKIALSYSQVGSKSLKILAFRDGDKKIGNVNFRILSKKAVKPLLYEIVKVLPHDPKAYTQGYELYNGFLYESLGQYRQSEIRKQEFPSTKILKSFALPSELFAEGLSILRDTVYQATWKARKCLSYDLDLNPIAKMNIPTVEGWGLTNDGKHLIISDGSHIIYYLDSKMNIVKAQEIYNQRQALGQLNELEYVDNKIYANIYTTDYIFVFNPQNGVAEAYVDLAPLRKKLNNPAAEVLNGIAYIKETGNFLVTGKYWDKAFIIKLI
tara:strand:+ start:108028 stop:109086 length:1059 start_codon:yes stop_codon:yes gene_type:complete